MKLKKETVSLHFIEPVTKTYPDVVFVQSYTAVVKEPMDLETIEARLRRQTKAGGSQHHYDGVQAVTKDINLIVANCKRFNRGHDEHCKDMKQQVGRCGKSTKVR